MNPVELGINHFAGVWAAAMERACLQGGAALAIAWIVCRVFPKLSAGTRCWLLRLAYLKLFLALFFITPIDIPLLHAPTLAAQTGSDASVNGPAVTPAISAKQLTGSSQFEVKDTEGLSTLAPEFWLFVAWLAAFAIGAWQMLRSYRNAAQLRAGAKHLDDPATLIECERLCAEMGMKSMPPILLIDGRFTALALGSFRPAILLGKGLWNDPDIDSDERRLILAHEMAHLARRDLLWNLLPIAARTLFVFHPLVWAADREWNQIQEMACDAYVLQTVKPRASDYGSTLLKAAAHIRNSPQRQAVALSAVESYNALQRRLESMKTSHVFTRRNAVLTAPVLIIAGVLCMVPWRLTAAPRSGKVVLLDHSRCHSEKDLPGGFVYDQEMEDFADAATYALSEVDVPESGWLVDSITVYFESPSNEQMSPQGKSVPHSDGWQKVNKARLNIFTKTGNVPSAKDDPCKGEVVTITQKALKDGVYAVTVGGLKRKMSPGKYWVGLTPMFNWKRNGQGYHVMTLDKHSGDEGVLRNTGGSQHFGPEDETGWKIISHVYGGALEGEEPAIKIEGSLIDSKVAAG